MFAFPETFTLIGEAVTGEDGDGNDVTTPTESTVLGAFAPAGSTELVQGEDVVLTNPTLYLETGSPIPKATDRFRIRGEVYQVDGEPQFFHNPFTGDEPGPVVRLSKVT